MIRWGSIFLSFLFICGLISAPPLAAKPRTPHKFAKLKLSKFQGKSKDDHHPPEHSCAGGRVHREWFADFDHDGFGDANDATFACHAPEGFVNNDTDCDDGDASSHPDAMELCDGIDNDCDGDVDEGLEIHTFYLDADGDSFGQSTQTRESCQTEIAGFVTDASDCEDENPLIHPQATESSERTDGQCDDGVDQNCDGVDVACNGIDADQDGFTSVDSGGKDCDDTNSRVFPGAEDSCDGLDNDCNNEIDEGFVLGDWCSVGKGECYDTGMIICSEDGESTKCSAVAAMPQAEICDGRDNDCDGFVDKDPVDAWSWYTDADNDGFGGQFLEMSSCYRYADFVNDSVDCNDRNYRVNPYNRETCDGIDNNCNGRVDEVCYCLPTTEICGDGIDQDCDRQDLPCGGDTDNDGDGYAATEGDCDDADPDVYPDAKEYCDGIDNNCDDKIDDYTSVDALTWYYDFDGDGFGAFMPKILSCDPLGSDWITQGGDCNDYNTSVNPDWFEECGDGRDNNCDGNVDEWCE